ncbi:MAG TPA: tetraacyldisaccharide 4'-kinase [Rhizomicrobium sp.]|nr:tetraacyldisaccharide 4'-kinase [Rhizomicrobium sp.]
MRAPEFWTGKDGASRLTATALSPLGRLYGAVTAWKRTHAAPYCAKAKIACIGNLTVGGSGKTPVSLAVLDILQSRNVSAAALTRGYGGRIRKPTVVDSSLHTAADVGDEALLLAARNRTIVSADRPLGARLADAEGVAVIVMDDGYQNFSLAKDLQILVVDAEAGFGNGHILPAGPLRERIEDGLARADAVVFVGAGSPALPGFSGPVFRARLIPSRGEDLASRRVLAFAGIGRPEKFFDTLRALGASVVATYPFPDHHVFRTDEIAKLRSNAVSENAMLITTEKDYVRLAPAERGDIQVLAVRAALEQPQAFEQFVMTRLNCLPK